MKPGKTAFSSAFALSVTAPLGTSKGTPPTTIQLPGTSTLPVSTPWQTIGSPVGAETVSTAEEFAQSSSHWTPTVPQGPSTPSLVWTLRNYKVILATDGIRKPDSRALQGPHAEPRLGTSCLFSCSNSGFGNCWAARYIPGSGTNQPCPAPCRVPFSCAIQPSQRESQRCLTLHLLTSSR